MMLREDLQLFLFRFWHLSFFYYLEHEGRKNIIDLFQDSLYLETWEEAFPRVGISLKQD